MSVTTARDQDRVEFERRARCKAEPARVTRRTQIILLSERGSSHWDGAVGKLLLDVRERDCRSCGEHHDRDIAAVINILLEGQRIMSTTVAAGLAGHGETTAEGR
ncbi:zinc ribbon domain-containing protein [Sphaerisporangium sp. NPDC088356]|uniref:zinc ribbon domain-containing protein n=1 Tax=Sphaerisporangium sp. NPDC088356 TaxID=3154871 RepID=UPI003444DDED